MVEVYTRFAYTRTGFELLQSLLCKCGSNGVEPAAASSTCLVGRASRRRTHLDELKSLELGVRPARTDANDVSRLRGFVLVVHVKLCGLCLCLLVERVHDFSFHHDDSGFRGGCGHHLALHDLPRGCCDSTSRCTSQRRLTDQRGARKHKRRHGNNGGASGGRGGGTLWLRREKEKEEGVWIE